MGIFKPKNPPSKANLEICERLGIKVNRRMSNVDVHRKIEKAIRKPKYKALYEELQREKAAEIERADREEYGDELYEEISKWGRMCDPHHQYLAVFKSGGKTQVDILELEGVDIDGAVASSLRIDALRPKRYRDRETGEYLEWEKELRLRPSQILEIQRLVHPVDMDDVDEYERILETRNSQLADDV